MKKPTVKQLKKKLDEVASEYYRKRDDGQCYTCPTKKRWKEMQCGHFVPRNALAVRYDDRNNHCQCVACNIFKKGNMVEYTLRMIKQYGIDVVDHLNREKHRVVKWTVLDYQTLIEVFKQKIKDLHYEE